MTKQQFEDIFKQCSFCKALIENFDIDTVEHNEAKTFESLVNDCNPENWVTRAARWATTPQGIDYWVEVQDDWRDFVESDGTNFKCILKWYKEGQTKIDKAVERYTQKDWIRVFKACSFYQAVVDYYNNSDYGEADTIEEFLEKTSPVDFVGNAFYFEDSDEGYDYWDEIRTNWRRAIEGSTLQPISEYYTPATNQGETFSVTMPKKATIRLNFQL